LSRRNALLLLVAWYVAAVAVRLGAPSDLDNRDQAKQGLYVIDVVYNGNYILPTVNDIEPATKPPLYNWVAAGISLVYGDVTELTIRLPSVLCGFAVVLLTFLIGEMLISGRVGLFGGFVLVSNHHFVTLACTARTDMMLCLLISLALLFFLYAYHEPAGKGRNFYVLMAFLCLGFGTLTKGPVAPALVAAVVVIFLLFKKDFKWLRTVPLVRGAAIVLLITLTWFILALREGGREFFEIVVLDESVNRFLGIGRRADKTRPFYYLAGHFFGKFLPWSFFVPTAVIRYWKADDSEEKTKLLLPFVWLFGVLIFFSISKGKRTDYILPMYPAASLIVAWLWLSLSEEPPGGRLWKQLRAVVGGYAGGCMALAVLFLAFVIVPGAGDAIARIFPDKSDKTALLLDALTMRMYLFLLISIPLAAASAAALACALRGQTKRLLVLTLAVSALTATLYFHFLSSKAISRSGEQKKAFCKNVMQMVGPDDSLGFLGVKNSIHFYLKKHTRPLNREEALVFLQSADSSFLITTEREYHRLDKTADFEIAILEESDYLIREEQKYLLLGRQTEAESKGGLSQGSNRGSGERRGD
jgi:hypothetical protein